MTPTATRVCAGTKGFTTTGYGFQPVRCRQTLGLVRVGPAWACADHREQVRRLVARNTLTMPGRCPSCDSRLDADGECPNGDCGLWRGPA